MSRLTMIALSLAGGILMAASWYPSFPGFLLFFAFVPLLILLETTEQNHNIYGNRLLFFQVLPALLVFNLTSLAWIRIAGVPLMITAVTGNTLLMALTLWLAWLIKNNSRINSIIIVITLWLSMEYLTNSISFLSPWLNLGNGLAKEIWAIQWYEYTGVAGGTVWIITINYIITHAVIALGNRKVTVIKRVIMPVLTIVIIVPLVISYSITRNMPGSSTTKVHLVMIQPNSDPYTEKFIIPFEEQLERVLSMAGEAASGDTRWFIAPETTIDDAIMLDSIDDNKYVVKIKEFLTSHGDGLFLTGATTLSSHPFTARHNSALLISPSQPVTVYHKSKLVPGVERTFDGPVRLLQKLFPDFGGTTGGYSGQESVSNLTDAESGLSAAPVICFESAFGNYVARFVRKGASFLAVITNDGWWKGTYGYYQHLSLSKLRAIETRRTVVRVANTGISALINTRGEITESLPWWESGTITAEISAEKGLTFFVRHGDILYRTAATISAFLITIYLVAIPLRKKVI